MWTPSLPSSAHRVAVPASRVCELPLALVATLREAARCEATDAVFDVVELVRLPRATHRSGASSASTADTLVAMSPAELARQEERSGARDSLAGLTVVSTRAAHQTRPLVERLERAGARVVALPAIATRAPEDPAAVDAALSGLRRYHAAVFTSENGVRMTFERVRALGLDARAFAGLSVAAIGPGTAFALEREGIRADLVPDEHVGEALAASLVEALPSARRIVIFRATEARDALPRILRAADHDVDVIATYTTVQSFDVARFRSVRAAHERVAITFTSASTVSSVVGALRAAGALDLLTGCTLASIGPITSAALAGAGLAVSAEARPYTLDGLVGALASAVAMREASAEGPS